MTVQRHRSARAFLDRAQPWLVRAEVENGLVLGLARALLNDKLAYEEPFYLATIERDDEVAGCAFRTPPHPVALCLPASEEVGPIIEDLRQVYPTLPGVVGSKPVAKRFADAWTATSGGNWSTRFELRVHALTKVAFPNDGPAGSLRHAIDAEIDFANQWAAGFVEDAGVDDRQGNFGERLIERRRLYFWDDGGPRCMVAAARETPNVAWINAVYTPPEFRGEGYATAATAVLSQRLLEAGRTFCALYTDLANPSSNAIYRRIGYEPIRDDLHLDFC